jgi:hypothetical protein
VQEDVASIQVLDESILLQCWPQEPVVMKRGMFFFQIALAGSCGQGKVIKVDE